MPLRAKLTFAKRLVTGGDFRTGNAPRAREKLQNKGKSVNQTTIDTKVDVVGGGVFLVVSVLTDRHSGCVVCVPQQKQALTEKYKETPLGQFSDPRAPAALKSWSHCPTSGSRRYTFNRLSHVWKSPSSRWTPTAIYQIA